MELIDQHTKSIMEGCKERARDFGLNFPNETLEYIITNRDMLDLSPKHMIPTMYDYWVHDVEILKERGRYEIYPNNPFETVINTRPPISFYNDNNPDWLNVMIFYHVLAHIDFFQNNQFYSSTWNDDFLGKALSDKRLINNIRKRLGSEKRWVDYIIEFSRSIDNLVSFHKQISKNSQYFENFSEKIAFYFSDFLKEKKLSTSELLEEVKTYNSFKNYNNQDEMFLDYVRKRYPEFDSLFEKYKEEDKYIEDDLLEFLINESDVVNKRENKWMKDVMKVVRDTSLIFQPQIRTKIMNEGWATFWHQKLFMEDDRIQGHEVDFAKINSKVTAIPKTGFNPYGIGYKLFEFMHEMAEKGKLNYTYQRNLDIDFRNNFNDQTGEGYNFIFYLRKYFDDFSFLNFLDKNDFQEFVTRNKLFVSGKTTDHKNRTYKYYIKSRNGEDYRQLLINSLYHPPSISFFVGEDNDLYLKHKFEGKPLVTDYINNVLLGLEFLWGDIVRLETTELSLDEENLTIVDFFRIDEGDIRDEDLVKERVLYTMRKGRLTRRVMHYEE